MTEAEWLTSQDPALMTFFLRETASDRKMRLFAVARCRRIWPLLSDERSREAVEVAERFAEGEATPAELDAARAAACGAYQDGSAAFHGFRSDIKRPHSVAPHAAAIHTADPSGWHAGECARSAAYALFHNVPPFTQPEADAAARPELIAQTQLLRCVFGNPFRAVAFDSLWQTETVLALARIMYASRDFSGMPILADALQDAGCENEDILNHCRRPGEQVRGCWVLDLVLGKR
jgi:hypothetical protein